MDNNVKKLGWYAAAIRIFQICMFYLYMRASWGIEDALHNPNAPQGLHRYWFYLLIAEIAYYYLLVLFKALKQPGIGIKIAQASAILIYLPAFMFTNEDIRSNSMYYNLSVIIVNSVMLLHLLINNRFSWKFFKSLMPKARVLRSR